MSLIRSERADDILVLQLARGRANALNEELVNELRTAVERAAADPGVRALVLASAAPGLFCAGFDVNEVFGYERPRMLGFFASFVRVFEHLRTLPKPVLCAIAGHAYAGGAILALSADFRVMADSALLSVNEVDLGVSLPPSMIRALGAHATPELARSMLLGAEEITAARALAGGVISEAAAPGEVLAAALRRARKLATKPSEAFAVHKRALDPLGGVATSEAEIVQTIDAWFSAQGVERRQRLLQRMAERLAASKNLASS
jgi:enoyl-CoA hydratase/carnithine racemase